MADNPHTDNYKLNCLHSILGAAGGGAFQMENIQSTN